MQYTSFDKWVYKGICIGVKESAELLNKFRYFSSIRRSMYYLTIGKIDYINIVMSSKSSFLFRGFKRFISNKLMNIQQTFRRERLILLGFTPF